MNVQEYIREDGSNPYQVWFDGLNAMAAVKVAVARSRLEVGNTSNVKWFDGIGEYRIDWGPGYRIYLVQDGQELIMLLGVGRRSGSRQILIKPYCCIKNTNGENEMQSLNLSQKRRLKIYRNGKKGGKDGFKSRFSSDDRRSGSTGSRICCWPLG